MSYRQFFIKKAEQAAQGVQESVQPQTQETTPSQKKQNGSIMGKLQTALADELLAWYQYWTAYNMAKGKGRADTVPEFQAHAQEQMGHANKIILRIKQLGGTPIADPKDWTKYSNPWDPATMQDVGGLLDLTIKAQQTAIDFYKDFVEQVREQDPTTYHMLLDILSDEQQHKYDLDQIKDDVTK